VKGPKLAQIIEAHAAEIGIPQPDPHQRASLEDRIRKTARHEAGHAVAAAMLLLPEQVGRTTIEPSGPDRWGAQEITYDLFRARAGLEHSWEKRASLRAAGTIKYAGATAVWMERPLAEALKIGRLLESETVDDLAYEVAEELASRHPELDLESINDAVGDTEGDRRNLEWHARVHGCRRPANRWHRPSWERASRLVRHHRDAIERIEAAFLERGTLSGGAVVRLASA